MYIFTKPNQYTILLPELIGLLGITNITVRTFRHGLVFLSISLHFTLPTLIILIITTICTYLTLLQLS